MGLETQLNTGDNRVHALASPFEALDERSNWLGIIIEGDAYGKGLLAATVPKAEIVEWYGYAQVLVGGKTEPGKTMPVFNTLEDLDADDILANMSKINKLVNISFGRLFFFFLTQKMSLCRHPNYKNIEQT